ncbi:hypothetical protein [Pseudonocardia nigra]|uniref:hypothetical protein n=1 Tax=Pseudonocardia nigra TaxID=1921578 RepID=UPI001C5DF2DE|nr:hypothetical protein [Pseudonocardia nigra]
MATTSDLQLEEPERAGRRTEVAQRVAWGVFALIALAALAGLIGPGPLSSATVTDPSGLVRIDYDRFTRFKGDSSLQLQVQPAKPGTAEVWISSEFLSGVQIQQVWPQPDTWTAANGGDVLTFPVSDTDPVTVEMQVRPDHIGMLRGAIGVPGGEPAQFWQFGYP